MHDLPGPSGEGKGRLRTSKSLEVRIPDPKNWVLDMLKDGDREWYAWRQAFALQIRAVWGDLEKVFIDLRGLQVPMDDGLYQDKLVEHNVVLPGADPSAFGFKHVSNKLYMVLHTYSGTDARKLLEESFDRCGFEGYRLLNAAYDPLCVDAEQQLVERVLSIANWSIKGITQIESMMREAGMRIRAIEKQTKQGIEPGMRKVFQSMLFAKLDIDTKKYVQKEGGREDFDKLVACIKNLKALDKSMSTNKMDVSSMAEVDTHADFVAWNDAGCPEDWYKDDQGYGEEPGQLAALGKGKGGKGKGKGKGGKDGKGKGGKAGKGYG